MLFRKFWIIFLTIFQSLIFQSQFSLQNFYFFLKFLLTYQNLLIFLFLHIFNHLCTFKFSCFIWVLRFWNSCVFWLFLFESFISRLYEWIIWWNRISSILRLLASIFYFWLCRRRSKLFSRKTFCRAFYFFNFTESWLSSNQFLIRLRFRLTFWFQIYIYSNWVFRRIFRRKSIQFLNFRKYRIMNIWLFRVWAHCIWIFQ